MVNIMLQSIRNDKKYEPGSKSVTFAGLVKKGIVKSRQAW